MMFDILIWFVVAFALFWSAIAYAIFIVKKAIKK